MWWIVAQAALAAPAVSGSWELAEPPEVVKAKHAKALDSALAQLPWAFRPIARGQLAKPIGNCQQVTLAVESERFFAHCVGDEPFERALGAPQAQVTGRDGKPYRVEIDVGDEQVQLAFLGEDGGQRTRYSIDDGQLVLTKEILSSWFQSPVQWTVRYRKAP